MWPEMLDCTVCKDAAAPEKLPESAIATRAASWRRSTWPVWRGQRSGARRGRHDRQPGGNRARSLTDQDASARWWSNRGEWDMLPCGWRQVFDGWDMAPGPEPTPVNGGPEWPVSTLNGEPRPDGPMIWPSGWPTVDLSGGSRPGVMAPDRTAPPNVRSAAPTGEQPGEQLARVGPPRAELPRVDLADNGPAPANVGAVATLQARSLGELVSGAIAAGFVFVLAASVVSAFARIPGQGVRARLLVAFNYATFYMAVALLFGMVCLLLLGRSAARGGLAPATPAKPERPPARDVLVAVLAAESALVGLGSLVSFVLYVSLAGSLPDAGVGHMLAELAVVPVVAVTLLWGWAGGAAKLRRLFGVEGRSPGTPEAQAAHGPHRTASGNRRGPLEPGRPPATPPPGGSSRRAAGHTHREA